MALELAEDRGDGEGGDRGPPLGVEAVDRLHQADARDLDEVVVGLGAAGVARGEAAGEGHEAIDQLLAHRLRVVGGVPAQQHLLVGELLAGAR